MTNQLELSYDSKWRAKAAWERVLEECRRVVAVVSLKEVAYALDVPASQLAHALQERDRHYLRGEHLVQLVTLDPTDGLAGAIAAAGGYVVAPRVELTPEERLARIEAQLRALPDGVRSAIYRGAGVVER